MRNGAASGSGVAVGLAGEASLLVDGGALVQVDTGSGENSGTTVGNDAGASGTLTVTGAGSLYELLGTGRGLTVGNAGSGELILDQGGVLTGAQVAFLGLEQAAAGTVRVGPGSELRVEGTNPLLGYGGSLNVGLAGTGTLEVQGGSVVIDDQDGIVHGLQVGGATGCGGPCPLTGGSGEVVLDAGAALDVSGLLGGASIGADGAGSLRVAGASNFNVADDVGGGVSAGLTPGSRGEIVVTGEGSHLDAGGSLLLGVDLALADAGEARLEVTDHGQARAGDVFVGSGAVVTGDGSVVALHGAQNGEIQSRGIWEPGAPIGRLDVVGDLVQTGGTVRFEIAGTGAAEEWDRLGVGGSLALPAGSVRIDFVDGFLPEVGDEVILAYSPLVSLDTSAAPSYAGAAPGFQFEVVAEAPGVLFRALSDAEGFGVCQVAQLKAFSKLCKKLFDCGAGYAKKPAKDLGGAKRDACRGKGEESFAKAYDKAAAKAASKGELCGLTAPAAEAAGALREPADLLAGEILTGWDPAANGDDDTLRSALLKETGRLCGSDLGAQSQNAKQRDLAKRDSARAKARTSFDSKTAKAFEKADQAGVVYAGPQGGAIADATRAIARDATSRSAGVAP